MFQTRTENSENSLKETSDARVIKKKKESVPQVGNLLSLHIHIYTPTLTEKHKSEYLALALYTYPAVQCFITFCITCNTSV